MLLEQPVSDATRRVVRAIGLAVTILLLTMNVASAHEHRKVADGKYQLAVGFMNEPALTGQPNGLELEVTSVPAAGQSGATPTAGEGEEEEGPPVEGLEKTLKVEIIFGSQKKQLDLRPAFNQPGVYYADVIPASPGAYTFHIFGTIEEAPVDESFTGGPDTFSEVELASDLQFPATGGAAAASVDSSDDTARTVGYIALAVGAVGLVTGLAGLYMATAARRSTAPRAAATAEDDE